VKCERWRTERVTGNDKEIRTLGQKVRETRGVRKEKAVEGEESGLEKVKKRKGKVIKRGPTSYRRGCVDRFERARKDVL
jgi:hypothetical protein